MCPEGPSPACPSQLSKVELVRLANECSKDTYLAGLPQQLVNTVDMALHMGHVALPVHRFLLIASSSVFWDVLAFQDSTQADSVGHIPLIDDDQEGVVLALGYMYQQVLLSEVTPQIRSIEDAKYVGKFANKYGIQALLGGCDLYVQQWLINNFFEVRPRWPDAFPAGIADRLPEWVAFATNTNLHKSLMACEDWIVEAHKSTGHGSSAIGNLDIQFDVFSKESLVRILDTVFHERSSMLTHCLSGCQLMPSQ